MLPRLSPFLAPQFLDEVIVEHVAERTMTYIVEEPRQSHFFGCKFAIFLVAILYRVFGCQVLHVLLAKIGSPKGVFEP